MTYAPRSGSIPTLEVPDLSGFHRLHMIGIGGAGMSGIAQLLLSMGIEVQGSDLKDSRAMEDLRGAGAVVFVRHSAAQLGDPDAVVISSAVPESNSELVEARRRGLPVLARAQVLAALAAGKRTLAVSGTHGKTTTTSMISVVLERGGLDPTFVVGGDLNESGSGARPGGGELFVAEADESDGSFLLLSPDVAVVTNIEDDHLDFYRDGGEIEDAFASFFASAKAIVACGDDLGVRRALELAGREALTYGEGPDNDVVLTVGDSDGWNARGNLRLETGEELELALRVPGRHNLANAAAAVLAARWAGMNAASAALLMGEFSGVRRRFEHRGWVRGAEFVDDYAHHPTEVFATLDAARKEDHGRVVAVFQPHRYTRTRAMWRPLGESLASADVIVITEVYAAGEAPIPGVSAKLLIDALAEAGAGKRLVYLPRRSDVVQFLAGEVRSGDLVLTLGAGDITMVADETLERIRDLP
ncbi:MAG: UDP-N-acetylmuramate--L-alanine ligase [Actinomycetota bacterium]